MATVLCGLSPARADEGIGTDRPDFVESSQVVGPGRFQVEWGFARERSDDASGARLRIDSTPTLLRLGVSDTLELRIETDGYQRSRSEASAPLRVTRERGVADTSLGVKWHMQDGDQATGRPAIAWLLHVDVDTGSAAFRGSGLRPSLRVVGEWELADELSVGAMGGFAVDRNPDSGRFAAGILAPRGGGGELRRGHRVSPELLGPGRRCGLARDHPHLTGLGVRCRTVDQVLTQETASS